MPGPSPCLTQNRKPPLLRVGLARLLLVLGWRMLGRRRLGGKMIPQQGQRDIITSHGIPFTAI